jgi:putative transcription factor
VRCEVCGRKIHTEPVWAEIEGAKLTVCVECSKYGRVITRQEFDRARNPPKAVTSSTPVAVHVPMKKIQARVEITQEMVQDYPNKIRQAREKLGLSHEDLGKKISEKASVLRKLETGKMQPNNLLVTRLEHVLKIKLLAPISEEKVSQAAAPKAVSRELTLGDLMQFGKKGGEESKGRKPS